MNVVLKIGTTQIQLTSIWIKNIGFIKSTLDFDKDTKLINITDVVVRELKRLDISPSIETANEFGIFFSNILHSNFLEDEDKVEIWKTLSLDLYRCSINLFSGYLQVSDKFWKSLQTVKAKYSVIFTEDEVPVTEYNEIYLYVPLLLGIELPVEDEIRDYDPKYVDNSNRNIKDVNKRMDDINKSYPRLEKAVLEFVSLELDNPKLIVVTYKIIKLCYVMIMRSYKMSDNRGIILPSRILQLLRRTLSKDQYYYPEVLILNDIIGYDTARFITFQRWESYSQLRMFTDPKWKLYPVFRKSFKEQFDGDCVELSYYLRNYEVSFDDHNSCIIKIHRRETVDLTIENENVIITSSEQHPDEDKREYEFKIIIPNSYSLTYEQIIFIIDEIVERDKTTEEELKGLGLIITKTKGFVK